jgi:hypothetical protein
MSNFARKLSNHAGDGDQPGFGHTRHNKMNKPSASDGVSTGRQPGFPVLLVILLAVLAALFYRSFLSDQVLFSNDGPFGRVMSDSNRTDFSSAAAVWQDLNWLGNEGVTPSPNFNMFLLMLLKPLFYARFAAPIGLLVLGLSAWLFFRQLRLAPIACVLGGIATALNSDFFSTACWGIVDQSVCIAANYLALAAIARVLEGSPKRAWVRVILAGLAVGMGVMQGWDVGALFSLFVAAYVVYQALFMNETDGGAARNLGLGAGRVVVIAVFAGLIATNTLTSLIGTQIGGVAGMAQDEATREARWQQATEWSLPKSEVLQIMVPGVFGYRNNWHMYDDDQPKDDQYWGLIGEDGHGTFWRLSGTGLYAGVFVVAVALWGVLQSLRKGGSPFSTIQRRAIWFWTGVLVVTTLLSFGKYLPFFYRLFYSLPYASTIRNPTKFMHVFSWALVIVFAYGMHGLFKAYMENPVKRVGGFVAEFKAWWASAASFEQIWLAGSIFAIGITAVIWVVYSGKMDELQKYLQTVGIPESEAPGVAHFSLGAVGWFIFFLVLTVGLLLFIFIGRLSGPRAKWGGTLAIAALLVVDLGRADVPWINYWNTAYKYADDPIVTFLADKPYEHRVGALPWAAPDDRQFSTLYSIYGTAWKQHLFWYHNIQCVDIVQEPRVGQDKTDFMMAISGNPLRLWELTSTRYLLGESGIVKYLNQQLDPQKQRFKLAQFPDGRTATFNLAVKPGAPPVPASSADFTTEIRPDGQLAVIEFTGALPRACLVPNWVVETNNAEVLQMLAKPDFDPHQTVLVADAIPAPPPPGPNPGTGTVSITDYSPKRIVLAADVNSPSVLLMSDRYNPKWEVTVDGTRKDLLRCNSVERGVYLEAGKHEVVFRFTGDYTTFAISLGAGILGVLLCGWLALTPEPEPTEPAEARRAVVAPVAKAETGPDSPKKKTKKT